MSPSSSQEPTWLTAAQVKRMHAEAIRLFGGLDGVRDEGLLESAIGKPMHLWTHEEDASLFRLAVAYAFGIARNHPIVDGNKRTAMLAIRAFLFINDVTFRPDEFDGIRRLAERRGQDVRTLILELVSAELDRMDVGVKDEVFTDGIEHLIGSVEGPSDLSSNRRRLDGLGS